MRTTVGGCSSISITRMRITNIRNLRMSFTPRAKANRHLVRLDDPDMGVQFREFDVHTGKAFLWYLIYMEVQTSGSLRIGESIRWGDAVFQVLGMKNGWYEMSTSELKAGKFEMWGTEMLIEKINCSL